MVLLVGGEGEIRLATIYCVIGALKDTIYCGKIAVVIIQ